MAQDAQDAQGPGRPRDESIDQEVVTALLDLVKELGLGAVTMDAIAERAGVSKASIYRRWDTKEAMLVDGLASLASSAATPTGDDARSALTELLDQACDFLDSRSGNAFPWLVGEVTAGTPLGSQYAESVVRPRRQIVADVIRRGVETGQLRPDLDVEIATDLVGGITLTKKLQARYKEYPDDWVERVVDALLRGWSAE
jgi:AcrR family transcriptional regulator